MSNNELHDELRRIDLATAEQVHPNNRRRVMSALQVHFVNKPFVNLNLGLLSVWQIEIRNR